MIIKEIKILNNVINVKFLNEDGTLHRCSFTPLFDINQIEYEEIKQKAQELWTDEVVQEYKDSLNSDNLEVLNG